MILLDTSIWIDFLKGKDPVYSKVASLIEEKNVYAIEAVFAELLQGARSKKERQIITFFWENLPKIQSKNLLLNAGLESGLEKWFSKGIGLIDACIITASKEQKCKVWTLDKKLKVIVNSD